MRKVEAYQADNGELDRNPQRVKAHDIAIRFAQFAKDKAVGTSSPGTSKIDWHAAMELLDHPETVIEQLQEYIAIRDAE